MVQTLIPYTGMKGVSRLFATYAEDYSKIAEYYAGDWREERSYHTVAQQLQDSPLERRVLVKVLEEQNSKWGNPTIASQLLDPDSLAVVTGQQVGIFGGPLYTFYKALTVIRLSEQLTQRLSRPVVPVFWLEGGDHDLDEVRHISLTDKRIWYQGHTLPETGNLGSVGSLRFTAEIDSMRRTLTEELPATEFSHEVLTKYYSAYRQGVSFTDAFAETLLNLLGKDTLVLMNPLDCRLQELAAPLLKRELRDYKSTHSALKRVSAKLEKDYHAQVHIRPGNVFLLGESNRQVLVPTENGYHPQFEEKNSLSFEEAQDLPPCVLSPNVVMRPLVQDSLLPTIAYVAGPGEIAYFAQLKSLYAWAERPMPIIFPRTSLTIIEPRIAKMMDRHDLTIDELSDTIPGIMRKRVLEGSGITSAFNLASVKLEECADQLQPVVTGIDLTLHPTLKATHKQWIKELSKLKQRVEWAEKRRHQQLQVQIESCQDAIYPNGNFQERELPVLYYLAKYGPRFLDHLHSNLNIDNNSHHQLLPL